MSGKTQPQAGSTPERTLPPKKQTTEGKMRDVLRRAEIAKADITEVTQMTKRQALGILGSKRRQAARQSAIKKGGKPDDIYYAECERCNGPAFFMTKRPGGPLTDDDWYSTYKIQGMPYPGNEPYCQCCAEEGRGRVPVRILHWGANQNSVGGRFVPLPRQVRLLNKDSLDALVEEQEAEELV